MDWINVTPSQVDVLVPVVHELPAKTVPVKTPVEGTPGEGYEVGRIVVEPELITILGEQPVLDSIESITTEPVNIDGATQDVVERVAVIVPKGVTLDRENNNVTAVVRIEQTKDKSFVGLPVLAKNTPEGLTPEFPAPTVNISVKGAESLMERLMGADIEVFVDLKNLTGGEHQVPVQVNLPKGVTLTEKAPQQITVILEE